MGVNVLLVLLVPDKETFASRSGATVRHVNIRVSPWTTEMLYTNKLHRLCGRQIDKYLGFDGKTWLVKGKPPTMSTAG